MDRGSFTASVRQELAHLQLGDDQEVLAELVGLVRTAGRLTLQGSRPGPLVHLVTGSGAVARRAYALLYRVTGVRPELQVRSGPAVQHAPRYAVHPAGDPAALARVLGVLDDDGRLTHSLPPALLAGHPVAVLRGALLGGGSVSDPRREAHLEITTGDAEVAAQLAALLSDLLASPVRAATGERSRVVLKSGARIAELLGLLGATTAYLELEERRLRRQLRGEANRLANADRANLLRTIEASAAQAEVVARAVALHGWDGLTDELREVALVRLANPEASLTELGRLLDPPVGKSAVHRRLRRLEGLAVGPTDTVEGEPQDP